jgi:ABC-type dipeptide/oligopeptide/nickel transport system ATPase component
MSAPLLQVRGLRTVFPTRRGPVVAADGVDLEIAAGEALGVVGESGSGKSVTFLSILGLLRPPGRIEAGEILFDGRDLRRLPHGELRALRGRHMALAMQDALSALNPAFTIGEQIVETLQAHGLARDARAQAAALLARVGIPSAAERLDDYPHQFSGGDAPARHDRHRARRPPAPAGGRRAHHRARRHAARTGARPARRTPRTGRTRACADHP